MVEIEELIVGNRIRAAAESRVEPKTRPLRRLAGQKEQRLIRARDQDIVNPLPITTVALPRSVRTPNDLKLVPLTTVDSVGRREVLAQIVALRIVAELQSCPSEQVGRLV